MEIYLEFAKLLSVQRKIPQLLFFGTIGPQNMISLRKNIIEFQKKNPKCKEIDFIINSGGGSPSDAYRMIRNLRENFEIVNIIVPFWAKSAATLFSLGGNKIIMDEFGEFGPLDIQIGVEKEDGPELERESALNDEYSVRRIESRAQELYYQMYSNLYSSDEVKINKNELSKQLFDYLAKFYEPLLKQINPYNLGRKKRMLDIGEHYAERILILYNGVDEDKRRYLIDYLVNRCPDHGYVIDYNLISVFLDNVILSKTLGEDYERILRDLSLELLNSPNIEYIGYVDYNENDLGIVSDISNPNKTNKTKNGTKQKTSA